MIIHYICWQDCVAVIPSSVLEDDLEKWDPATEETEYARVLFFFTFSLMEQKDRPAFEEPIPCAFVEWIDTFAESRTAPGSFMRKAGM
jgi:hypothetical protein